MDFKNLEKRTGKKGTISYWKEGKILYKQCTKCKMIKSVEEYSKNKGKTYGLNSQCKICEKQWFIDNAEYRKEYKKVKDKEYRENHKEELKEYFKNYYQENKEERSAKGKIYREANREANIERCKKWYEKNKSEILENEKMQREEIKKQAIKNIKKLSEEIEQIIKEYKIPILGEIYKIENTKTGRVYIGQTKRGLNERYHGNPIKAWIKERSKKTTQRFKEEFIIEDFKIGKIADGISQFHLDKLEAYWIDFYKAFEDGYNNTPGNYYTTDGLEEFKQILNTYNLEFKDNKIIKKD